MRMVSRENSCHDKSNKPNSTGQHKHFRDHALVRTSCCCVQSAVLLFPNPYKRKKLQIPHYYINKLVRYRLAELRVWHAQLGELLASQTKEAQEQLAAQASRQAQGSEAAHA